MFHTNLNTSLISGTFIDRHNDGVRDIPEISDKDIENYLLGNWDHLTRQQIAFLKECDDDPDGIKWNRAHAHYIYCSPDWLFEILFVYFPTAESWEENYQSLRRLVGPEPLDYCNVSMAVNEKYRRECEAAGYEPPLSPRAIELLSTNPHWRAAHPELTTNN